MAQEGAVVRTYCGQTTRGDTAWNYVASEEDCCGCTCQGLCLTIDTSAAGFTSTPLYFTSISGDAGHWRVLGHNAIYLATPNSFKIFIHYQGNIEGGLTPSYANEMGWHINWCAYEIAGQ